MLRSSRVLGLPLLRLLLALPVVALLLGGAALAQPAHHAHAADFVTSDPPDHATLAHLPAKVVLTFDSRVLGDPTSMIDVRLGSHSAVLGDPVLDADTGTTLTAFLHPGLGDGLYTISWRAADFSDGSITSGTMTFFVGTPTATGTAPPGGTGRGSLIAALPVFPITGTGDGVAAGWLQVAEYGATDQVVLCLEQAAPLTAYTVQLCDPTLTNCSPSDGSITITTSEAGVAYAVLLLPTMPGTAGVVLVTSTVDANETYVAGVWQITVPNLDNYPAPTPDTDD